MRTDVSKFAAGEQRPRLDTLNNVAIKLSAGNHQIVSFPRRK